MSIVREDNTCTITFEDDAFKDGCADVFEVTEGATPFYVADTWKVNDQTTLRSGQITHGGTSETTISVILVEAGSVQFNCAISSEQNCDRLRVIIDEKEVVNISGTIDFKEYEFPLEAGMHELILRYTKDGSVDRGNDAGALGYIRFTGVELPFDTRFLMRDMNGKTYTVIDDIVTEVPELASIELSTKSVFQKHGFLKMPTPEQLGALTKPVLYRWADGDMHLMKAKATATPRAQTIRAVADLHHETILGIAGLTAVYRGNVTASYSYDDKSYTAPVPMEDFLKTDGDALYKGATNKMIYFKFVLEDTASSLTNFIVTYKNP